MTNKLPIRVRPVSSSDIDALTRIMFDTWYAADAQGADEETRARLMTMARYDVAHYLETSTHAYVAVREIRAGVVRATPASTNNAADSSTETVLGTAMWRNDTHWSGGASQREIAQTHLTAISAISAQDPQLRRMIDDFSADSARTDALANATARTCQAELRLFMVSESARGKRVGTQLLNAAQESMKNSGAKLYYLYTDSTCDFGYYDAHGFERVASALNVSGPNNALIDKFIYTRGL